MGSAVGPAPPFTPDPGQVQSHQMLLESSEKWRTEVV